MAQRPSILTPHLCDEGMRLVTPSITYAMTHGPLKRIAGAVVVLNPTILFEPKYDRGPRDPTFLSEVPFYAHLIGDVEKWEYPFALIAVAKAYATFKYRRPANEIQQECPFLFEPLMTKYGGSVICPRSGLIVAFSGVQEYFDRMVAQWLLSAITALSIHEMQAIMANDEVFFGYNTESMIPRDNPNSGLRDLYSVLGISLSSLPAGPIGQRAH